MIGEVNKWVPMSSQRVKAIDVGSSDVKVELEGVKDEVINFHIMYAGKSMVFTCKFRGDGLAILSLNNKMCG